MYGHLDAEPVLLPGSKVPGLLRDAITQIRGWLQFETTTGRRLLERIVICCPHPQRFTLQARKGHAADVCSGGFMERLLDIANIYVGESSPRPALVSTSRYLFTPTDLMCAPMHELLA